MVDKPKTNYILIGIAVVVVVLAIFFMNNSFISKEVSQSDITPSTSEQVLGFAALSAVEELRQDNVNGVNNTTFDHERINSKLYIANTFLSDVAEFNVEVQPGSLQGYDKTMIISYLDINKNVNIHEFHYNETIIEVENDEIESSISGIIIVNGVEYILEGTKEEEEEEFEYDLIAFLDDENYITIKYEVQEKSEIDIEKEFEYERFVDKQLVYRIEIEFEIEEDGEKEITIKFLDGGFESEYSFKSELEDDGEEIKIEYKISEAGVVIEEGEFFSYNKFNE